MILDLPSTSTREVSKRLLELRNSVGAMAMGRVLTLLVPVGEDAADAAVQAANDATRQHPARIIVVVSANARGRGRLDAQIRVGGDAGASEIVVLRLYGELTRQDAAVVTPLLLPDSPIVVWWPQGPPSDVGGSALGQMAHRRITDAARDTTTAKGAQPTELRRRARHYRAGDTDLAWTRVTRWRALLASALEAEPFEDIIAATVAAEAGSPSGDLLAGWLAWALKIKVTRVRTPAGSDLVSVRLERASGPIDLVRTDDAEDTATLSRVDALPRLVALQSPTLPEALAEELRRLDPDEIYAAALGEGLPQIRRGGTRAEAARAGSAPSGPAEVAPTGARSDATAAPGADPTATADGTDPTLAPGPDPTTPADGAAVEAAVQERLKQMNEDELRSGTAVRVAPDRDSLAAAVVDELVTRVSDAVAARGVAHVVLTGGSMGTAAMSALAARSADLDPATWRQVHLWWGDERYVPSGHEDRTDAQAEDAGLNDIPVLKKNVHRVPSGSNEARLGEAAARYATELASWATPPAGAPEFDVVMLGMGPDTHVASLFPGRLELSLREPTTAAVTDSPKPPPLRVTMTLPTLNAARSVWLLVAGADKADAVAQARATRDDHQVPASCVRGREETIWWLDEAAATAAT